MILSVVSALAAFGVVAFGVYWLMTDPRSPLPRSWNPLKPLVVTDAPSYLTGYKLRRVLAEPAMCLDTLEQAATFRRLEPRIHSEKCGIENRVELSAVAGIPLRPLETSCETALRLTLWAEHGLKPAATDLLGTAVRRLHHIGSYNCRPIRGSITRMSTHATAASVDIVGVTLSDGKRLNLLDGWDGAAPRPAFFEALRDEGCRWFQTVLEPEFNPLHADHFHFQSRGWGTCR